MRVSAVAPRMNIRGGLISIHYDRASDTTFDVKQPLTEIKPSSQADLLEARHAAYSELIRLSSASNYDLEIVSGREVYSRAASSEKNL